MLQTKFKASVPETFNIQWDMVSESKPQGKRILVVVIQKCFMYKVKRNWTRSNWNDPTLRQTLTGEHEKEPSETNKRGLDFVGVKHGLTALSYVQVTCRTPVVLFSIDNKKKASTTLFISYMTNLQKMYIFFIF